MSPTASVSLFADTERAIISTSKHYKRTFCDPQCVRNGCG